MISLRTLAVGVALAVAVASIRVALYQSERASSFAEALAQEGKAHDKTQAQLNGLLEKQKQIAELDAHYLEKIRDANKTIDALRRAVDAGNQRLYVSARCPDISGTASATRVDDAARARPSDAATRNYFTLRERIGIITAQLSGLQAYIRTQCVIYERQTPDSELGASE